MDGFVLMAIKRIAVETAFFCEGPYDSDNGFERLMACKTRSDLNNSAFGDVFLHSFLGGNRRTNFIADSIATRGHKCRQAS